MWSGLWIHPILLLEFLVKYQIMNGQLILRKFLWGRLITKSKYKMFMAKRMESISLNFWRKWMLHSMVWCMSLRKKCSINSSDYEASIFMWSCFGKSFKCWPSCHSWPRPEDFWSSSIWIFFVFCSNQDESWLYDSPIIFILCSGESIGRKASAAWDCSEFAFDYWCAFIAESGQPHEEQSEGWRCCQKKQDDKIEDSKKGNGKGKA